jgi:hypothetical protein
MSLAPAERQALARIEIALRRSDPDLAARLQAFGARPWWRSWPAWARPARWRPRAQRLLRARRLQLFVAAALMLLGVLWGFVLSSAGGPQRHAPACAHVTWHAQPCAAGHVPARGPGAPRPGAP